MLSHSDLLQLKRWNTPTIYNGLEQITQAERKSLVNLEETRDFMPQMGPMVGYAVTCTYEPSNPEHPQKNPTGWSDYRRYVAETMPAGVPKIVIVQDLDKPRTYGAFWGEVNSNIHRALGCVGSIIDGAIRDVDEMNNAGFKALARRLCVSHCYSHPVRWGCPVEVFGTRIEPGQLIHADKHGFLVIPAGEEKHLLEAARFMDANECQTVIPAARSASGKSAKEILAAIDRAGAQFGKNARAKFARKGEW